MHNIFQFIGIDVGEWLLNQGLSLEGCQQSCWADASHLIDIDPKTVQIDSPEGAKSCWSGVMLQKDPLPMLDWLGVHGPPLPDDYPFDATIGLCIPTVRWLLRHGKVSYAEWRDAACAAMRMGNPRAAMILEVILRSPHPEMPQTFSRYLMKELRDSAHMTMYKWSFEKSEFLFDYAERMRVISKVKIDVTFRLFRLFRRKREIYSTRHAKNCKMRFYLSPRKLSCDGYAGFRIPENPRIIGVLCVRNSSSRKYYQPL